MKTIISLILTIVLSEGMVMAHTSIATLQDKLTQATQLIEVGAYYYHYRNPQSLYKIIAIALQEASEKVCVIYQSCDNNLIWVRDLDLWCELVEYKGQLVPRFQKAITQEVQIKPTATHSAL